MAPRNRSHSFVGRRSGIRRSTEWGIFQSTATTVIVGAANVLVGSFTAATLAPVVPGTIVRIRGSVLWRSDQAAADEVQLGAFGIAVVSERARATGVAALPIPDAAAGGWGDDLWIHTQALQNSGMAGIAAGRQHIEAIQFDSKGMRKLNDGEAIVVVGSNWGATGAEIMVSFRMLFKKGRSG